jgi:hypothetical protein
VESYPTAKDKLALLIESTCIAKSVLVHEKGIGEDLPPTLVGWDDDTFTILIQAGERMMSRPRDQRLESLYRCAMHVRDGWYNNTFTFISEGYCQITNTDNPETRPLDQAFVDNHDVTECLTFIHVTEGTTTVVVLPYRQLLGRVVEYDVIQRAKAALFEPQAAPLRQALTIEPDTPYDEWDNHIARVVDLIEREGWQVVHDLWD